MSNSKSTAAAFRNWLRELLPSHRELLAEGPVYLGVSGGADSLAMAYSAVGIAKSADGELSGDLVALIVDHQLQDGSAQVARRAAEHCEDMGLRAEILTVTVPGADEAAARAARYQALGARAAGRPLLVAHTADDDAEGVLLGLARGSGTGAIAGLRAISTEHPATRGAASGVGTNTSETDAPTGGAALLGRPLLASRRADTLATCQRAGIEPWHDPHNEDPRFLRSLIRTELIPELTRVLGPGLPAALARTAQLAREDDDALTALAADNLVGVGIGVDGVASEKRTENAPDLPIDALSGHGPAIRRRMIQQWLRGHTGALTHAHLIGIDALVTEWAGQGGVSVPWPTMERYRSKRHNRLIVERQSGVLRLLSEVSPR